MVEGDILAVDMFTDEAPISKWRKYERKFLLRYAVDRDDG